MVAKNAGHSQAIRKKPSSKERLQATGFSIINGDPNYIDSWVDIAGYATLVADRLNGVER